MRQSFIDKWNLTPRIGYGFTGLYDYPEIVEGYQVSLHKRANIVAPDLRDIAITFTPLDRSLTKYGVWVSESDITYTHPTERFREILNSLLNP